MGERETGQREADRWGRDNWRETDRSERETDRFWTLNGSICVAFRVLQLSNSSEALEKMYSRK